LPEEDSTEAETNDFGTGAIALANFGTDTPPPVCFLLGTFIQTPSGPVIVDDLKSGDLVMTVDGGVQPGFLGHIIASHMAGQRRKAQADHD
jgi:hypothetical protein